MTTQQERGKRARTPARAAFVVDEVARVRIETELRNHLAGREPEFASAVLARITGTLASLDKRPVDSWFDAAARALCDEGSIATRVEASDRACRTTLALLASSPWWSRSALVQALALASGAGHGDDEDGIARSLADVLSKWPVLVRTNPWTRAEELSLFEPLAARIRPLLSRALAVGRSKGEPLPSVGLDRTLLALALFPGLVAQRRPRVTRMGELHGADATKLERALGESRGLFATWMQLGAFEEVDGALAPVASRVRAILASPASIAAAFLEQRLGDIGWPLATIAAQADEGDALELGAALLAVGLRAGLGYGFDVSTLSARIERDALHLAPLLGVDVRADTLAIPSDVRAAIRGETRPSVSGTGYVQPNYEVVLPAGVPLAAAFVIGCAAELVHVEAVARLKLTRASVLAARSVGLEVSDVIDALEAIAVGRGIPPAVRHAVEEWGEAVGEARVRTAVLFEVRATDALLMKVEQLLAPVILDRPARHLFVLSRGPTPRELGELRTAGVLTRSVASTSSKPRTEAEEARSADATPWELLNERSPPRDLKRALDPHRILALVDGSRGRGRSAALPSGAGSPQSAPRNALDPDDGDSRPIPEAVEAAVEEALSVWSQRGDWTSQLRSIVAGASFRRVAAVSPGPLILALRRASDPQRFQLQIARLVAEQSMRRASDT